MAVPGFLKTYFPTAGAVRYRLRHDALLHVIEARRGRGKSYAMTWLLVEHLVGGGRIVTNTTAVDFYRVAVMLCRRGRFRSVADALVFIRERVTIASCWDDFYRAYDALVIFDECIRHFDSRPGMSSKPPTLFFEWVRQTRKLLVTVYFVVHSTEWLDKRLSQLLDVHWFVRKESDKTRRAPDGTPFPVRFHLYGNDPGGVGKVETLNRATADLVWSLSFDVRIAQAYESRGLIREIGDEATFGTVADIRQWHLGQGHEVGLDGEERLALQLARVGVHGDARRRAQRVSTCGTVCDRPLSAGDVARMARNRPDLFYGANVTVDRAPAPV